MLRAYATTKSELQNENIDLMYSVAYARLEEADRQTEEQEAIRAARAHKKKETKERVS